MKDSAALNCVYFQEAVAFHKSYFLLADFKFNFKWFDETTRFVE